MVNKINEEKENFGKKKKQNKSANVEFVSCNPTGPLTVGHGRQAILGDMVSNILTWSGYDVSREYYYNDAGKQMRVLAESCYAKYAQQIGLKVPTPENGYVGKYLDDIALKIIDKYGKNLKSDNKIFRDFTEKEIFSNIKNTLDSIGIKFDIFTKEGSFYENGAIDNVLKELIKGCKLLEKNKCKFIVMPCNTAHFWYDDLRKKVKIPILSMPEEVYNHTKKSCRINSQIGILATEATLNTKIYHKYFNKRFKLLSPPYKIQKKNVNKAIKFVKMGNVRKAEKIIKPAIDYLIKINCKKIILGCTELPIAIFAFKSFKKAKKSKIFIDPNLILANTCVNKYKAA